MASIMDVFTSYNRVGCSYSSFSHLAIIPAYHSVISLWLKLVSTLWALLPLSLSIPTILLLIVNKQGQASWKAARQVPQTMAGHLVYLGTAKSTLLGAVTQIEGATSGVKTKVLKLNRLHPAPL